MSAGLASEAVTSDTECTYTRRSSCGYRSLCGVCAYTLHIHADTRTSFLDFLDEFSRRKGKKKEEADKAHRQAQERRRE